MDPFPDAKDRVITIYWYAKEKEDVQIDGEFDDRKLLCAAQDALLKVHAAIVNSTEAVRDSDENRKDKDKCQILVPSSQSANIIGKTGATIQKLRSKTRAHIRVTAKDAADPAHSCAMEFDNFVSISGATIEISESRSSRGERIALISGSFEQKRAAGNLTQAFIMST